MNAKNAPELHPRYNVLWDPARDKYIAQAADAWSAGMSWSSASPSDALAGLIEMRRLRLAGVVEEPRVGWLDDVETVVCPIHLHYAPCRKQHVTTPDGDAPYTANPRVLKAAERRAAGVPADLVLLDLYAESDRPG